MCSVLPLAVSVSPPGDRDLERGLARAAGWDGRDPKSIWVWCRHICLVATNTTRCWEAAAGRTTCQLQPFTTTFVGFFFSQQQCDRCFFSPGKYPNAHVCLTKCDGNVKLFLRQIIGSDCALRDPVQSGLCVSQLQVWHKSAVRFSTARLIKIED